jgi:flagellar hook-associated protein 1 FlgK
MLGRADRAFAMSGPASPEAVPYRGTLAGFARSLISQHGLASENADRLAEGQRVVVENLRTRFDETAGVDVDTEMSRLIALQTAYGANARIMSAVKEMFDTLLRT